MSRRRRPSPGPRPVHEYGVLPPHSSRTGVNVFAQAAITFLPVGVDPVKRSHAGLAQRRARGTGDP